MFIRTTLNELVNLDNFDMVKIGGEKRVDTDVFVIRATKNFCMPLIAEFKTLKEAEHVLGLLFDKLYSGANAFDVKKYLEIEV